MTKTDNEQQPQEKPEKQDGVAAEQTEKQDDGSKEVGAAEQNDANQGKAAVEDNKPAPEVQEAQDGDSGSQRIKELEDELLRSKAENQNIAKRMRAEIGRAEQRGIEAVVTRMLEIADDLERAIESGTSNPEAVVDGVALTMSKMQALMGTLGIETIDPEPGVPLDPHLHMAIGKEPVEDMPANSVRRVVLKGYRHQQRIIRPANIIVCVPVENKPAQSDSETTTKN